jgi:hypothetical protein
MRDFDLYFEKQEEPARSCLMALRSLIESCDKQITTSLKYGMPFFCFKNRMFAYLWRDKKTGQPYLGFVEGKKLDHPKLEQEKRARMKVWRFDVTRDLPVAAIQKLVKQALDLYKKGIVPTK